MKSCKHTLLLMRHAKSSWDFPDLDDAERPLNRRGEDAVAVMGERLKRSGYHPDLMITSPALRAKETARRIAVALNYPAAGIREEPSLYFEGSGAYLELIRSLGEEKRQVMMVGHNPDMEELVAELGGKQFTKFPTCAYALIGYQCRWSEIAEGKLLDYDFPKSSR